MDRFQKLAALSGHAETPSAPQHARPRDPPSSMDPGSGSGECVTGVQAARGAVHAGIGLGSSEGEPSQAQKPARLGPERTGYEQLQSGELAPEGESFVSWAAVKKYPYSYVGVGNRQKVCEGFFDGGKIVNEPWDFFYIYRGPTDLNLQPLLLIPTRQVEAFLDRVNLTLSINLTIPSGGANGSFQATFSNDGNPQPRYLGFSSDSKMAERLRNNVPPHYYKLDGEPGAIGTPSDRSLAAFRAKIALMTQAAKGKKVANKEKQKKERIERQQAWHHSIKRVQRYLGLRTSSSSREAEVRATLEVSGLGWDAFNDAVKAVLAKLPPSAVFDAGKPALYQQEHSVVFVCVDVEAYERSPRLITEIGIATLDTKDLLDLAPGDGGSEWLKKIRARHFRISEHKHLNNTEFVNGCADRFEFGDSEFISLADAPRVIASCFKHPFSGPENADANGEEAPQCNIILVGHDVGADINFMKSIGYDITNLSNLLEQADTAVMWRYLKRELNPRNLASILAELGIVAWNLHNAGNDAAYTLQAMVAIAIKHIDEKQKKKREVKEREKRDRITESVKEATETAVEKEEGWSSGGENSDGGAPVRIVAQPSKPKKPQPPPRTQSPVSSHMDSRGPWADAAPSRGGSWENNTAASPWGQSPTWGANSNINSQWETPPAAPPFAARNGRRGGQWRSGSAPTVGSSETARETERPEMLTNNAAISTQPTAAAERDVLAAPWTTPKPETPRQSPQRTGLGSREEK